MKKYGENAKNGDIMDDGVRRDKINDCWVFILRRKRKKN